MLPRLLCAIVLLTPLAGVRSHAQSPDPPPTLAVRLAEVLHHESNGHSPTPEEIAAFDPITPLPDSAALAEALPLLLKALDSPDAAVRSLALTALDGLQTAPAEAPPASPTQPPTIPDPASPAPPAATPTPAITPPGLPAAYKPEIAAALTPAIGKIAAHLTDDSPSLRLQAAIVLGGFTPDPPATLFPPLLAFLKRDDAIGTMGQAVVSDLLQIAPVAAPSAEALARFLRRSDQTSASRADLVDAIASKPNQSQSLNKTLLLYLASDDPSLRARLILSLPQLDLAADVFTDTKALVDQLANNSQENLQVVNAARAIATCWTAPHMLTGCPAY